MLRGCSVCAVTDDPRNRWLWAAVVGAGAVTAGVLAQQQLMKRIAADPEGAALGAPLHGTAREVRSADGTVLYANLFGPEEGQTVVLAHGWTENLTFWTYQIQALAERGLRVVAYDLRGHGKSAPAVDHDYSIDRFGEDLEAVLETCVPDGRRAVVAGHSLGAMAIAAWARDHEVAPRVGAAALINTGVGDLIAQQLLFPLPGIAQALNHTIALHGFLGSRAPLPPVCTPLDAGMIRYVAFGPEATPAQVAFYERMLIAVPPDIRATVGIAISEVELHDALPRLTIPTIVVAGENDRLTPAAHARRIAGMLPQLERLLVLPVTGHMAPLERHQEIVEILWELAEKVPRGAPAVPA